MLYEDILKKLEEDDGAFDSGRTNDDVVNSMIACECAGIDWREWFDQHWTMTPRIEEHARRIQPYIPGWFVNGKEEALSFLVL